GGAPAAAPEPDLAEERDVAGPDALRDLDLVGVLHGVRGEGVDLARIDPRVVQRGHDALARQRLLRRIETLGEGRLAASADARPGLHNGTSLNLTGPRKRPRGWRFARARRRGRSYVPTVRPGDLNRAMSDCNQEEPRGDLIWGTIPALIRASAEQFGDAPAVED